MQQTKKNTVGTFWSTIITIACIFAAIDYGIPYISRGITGLEFSLPVPGTLKTVYRILIILAAYLYLSCDEERYNEFLRPPLRLLRGEYGITIRLLFLVAGPLLLGKMVYHHTIPKDTLPVSMRVQHPSSNFPGRFEKMKNPYRNPPDKDVDLFIEQVKTGTVEFHPLTKRTGGIEFIPTKPVQEFLQALQSGENDRDKARAALMEKNLYEGRILYGINCSPCHGDSAEGDGPMAKGFKLKPINFTETGTIEILIEGYAYWRVSTGGLGLPIEATPWESAMPVWQLDLTEEERWKTLLAAYDLAEKTPRVPEKIE